MKKLLSLLLVLALFALGSCQSDTLDNKNESSSDFTNLNTLVVYYSATNNTERVATYISEYLNIATFELEPLIPYSIEDLNYSNQDSRVVKEHNDPNRHTELVSIEISNFENYDYIFLGFPVWWQEPSWVINDFISNNSFTDKTIIPFATSASSGYNDSILEELAKNEGRWIDGKRFSSSVTRNDVISWIDNLNLNSLQ